MALRFFYNPAYKYTNRTIIDLTGDTNYKDIDYENIDSPDTINGHIIYTLTTGESIPTYIYDTVKGWRWFVSGITQKRTDKYQISLLRDVISESDKWKDESAYIEAGTATDYCKYKKWNLPFTNTKVAQQRLNINGKSSFFVFYVNEQDINSDILTETDLKVKYTAVPGIDHIDYDLDALSDISNINYAGQTVRYVSYYLANAYIQNRDNENLAYTNQISYSNTTGYSCNRSTYRWTTYLKPDSTTMFHLNEKDDNYTVYNAFQNAITSFTQNYVSNITLTNKVSKSSVDGLMAYVGKIIRVPNSQNPSLYDYYTLSVSQNEITTNTYSLSTTATASLTAALRNTLPTSTFAEVGDHYMNMYYKTMETTFELVSLGTGVSFDFTFKADVQKLPKSSVRCVNIVSDANTSDETIAQCLMLSMANPRNEDALSRIIDVQYLPFSIATTTNSNFTVGNANLTAAFISQDDLYYTTSLTTLTNINKETDSIMIVSPSRKSQFKFSPYNTDGKMVFTSRITLRPNQSIMYIRPTTQGLLMQDWDDKECLIIQEDFSLTKIDSAWTEYVYSNRNYQNAFNLTIQTKEFERSWERRIEQAQKRADSDTAKAMTAERVKVWSGNLPILSNIYAAAFSGIEDQGYMNAANLDRQYNEAMYQKGIEVAKTNFEYQIDNIKSQPLIPNTITAIDVKLLDGVYLEFYSTNPTELDAIASFYFHNGNRIDNYGTFRKYWGGFIRGKIIRAINYTQPEIDEINRRLEMGLYTGGIV